MAQGSGAVAIRAAREADIPSMTGLLLEDAQERSEGDPGLLMPECFVTTSAAEAAFARRGIGAAVVICPAAWLSKIEALEAAGYRIAISWMIR